MDEATGTQVDPIPGASGDPLVGCDDGECGLGDTDLSVDELAARWEWESAREAFGPGMAPITPVVAAQWAIDDAVVAQRELNRAMAGQLGALAELFEVARTHPQLYVTPEGMDARDALELAERSAALDAGLQLHLSANQVRNRAHEGQVLTDRLRAEPPELRHARAVVDRRVVLEPAPDGMAWIHAYLSAPDAMLIKRRLDLTAKN
ncbi:MAG: hypothetical protein LH624_16270, partial [Cryobacterium sp.]|nr:hypothetical protein [Cryobacterium sp.]